MTDPNAAFLGVPAAAPRPSPQVPERAPGVIPSSVSRAFTPEDVSRVAPATPPVVLPAAARHRAQRPGPGIQLLLRRTRLTSIVGQPPAQPTPPLVLLGRPGTTPDSIPHLAAAPLAPTAALRTAGLRVLFDALVAADPDESSLARRRAAATGLHPVDTSGAPVLSYRVKTGDDLESVARVAGCSGRAVLAANGMRPGATLKAGQLIRLPALAPDSPSARRRRLESPDTTREQAARRRRTRRGEVIPAGDLPRRSYPAAVTRAAVTNRDALKRADVPDRATVRGLVRATAVHFGLDPALAVAVASMESGFDQRLVSPANAIGVMQLLPSAGAWAGELLGRPLDLLDTKDNITAGVVLLLALGHRTDEQTALAGYYQGLASVRRHGTFPDTRRYVATVRTLKLRFR
ncbi:LysM peptidoglycan-binding domain-containing protein [Kineosporia babensis]|uniref:LysM peptidoglycan-binding domain-containing protein n=1 Tax=Kineosporia babensis TaxID=499548 RepID=A0A9X1NDX7_9ACTN|nr:LysM peptidoglycan-binding domain-containing protein [Kineosporia babensis]MCD5311511.1 LysM peptidoglycan-binding domain-containing protein [Kineosporia babensis]